MAVSVMHCMMISGMEAEAELLAGPPAFTAGPSVTNKGPLEG